MQAEIQLSLESFLRTSCLDPKLDEKYKQAIPPSAPIPPPLTLADQYAIFLTNWEEMLNNNSLAFDFTTGTLKVMDKTARDKHYSVVFEVLKKFSKGLFSSTTLGASLPCLLFEARSETDRIAELWRVKAFYLSKAAMITDKVERMKLVVTSEIAQNYLGARKLKSFNPLLGETFECSVSDGSQVYTEQICHHPPITAYYISGPNKGYTQGGSEHYEVAFKGNCVITTIHPKCTIRFKDGQEISLIEKPNIKVAGLLFGDTHALMKGKQVLCDKKNKMKAVVFYDFGEKKGLFGSDKTVTKDKIEGIIYVTKDAPPTDGQERRIEDLNDVKLEIARIKGSWFDNVTINDVNYWNISKLQPLKVSLPENPLPSDCRYREDMIWLRKENLAYADAWKDALEIRQRKDRKLREEYASGTAATSTTNSKDSK